MKHLKALGVGLLVVCCAALFLYAAASYLSESFEGAGYENSWSETIAAGCTVDEDSTDTVPDGGGSQSLRMVSENSADITQTLYTLSTEAANTWTTFYFRLSYLSDSSRPFIARAVDSAWADTWGLKVGNNGGTYRLFINVYYNGTSNSEVDNKIISIDTWYKIDIKYDAANTAWEWRVDGVSEGSGALSGDLSDGIKYYYFQVTTWNADHDISLYFDRLWVDDSEYGYGSSVAYVPRVIVIQ